MPEVRIVIPEDLDRALDGLINQGFAGNKAELARTAITHFLSTIPTQLPKGYDLETAFSPDGRVFQLEYASETVKHGGTIVGVWCDDGVALAKELPKEDAFMVFPNPFVQTFKIGESIGIVYCGILTDGYFLVEEARKIVGTTGEKDTTDVEALVQKLALFMQPYSQRKDVRPFAAALIVGGLDSEKRPRLFLLNSSGLAQEYKACHVGVGSDETKEILKSGYKPKLKLEEAVALAARAALKETRKPENVLLATIEAKTKRFREISLGEKDRMWKTVFP
jgi:20S proteasome alpha/beta subunit